MKKLFILAVAPFFAIAACGNLELVLPPDAVAGNGGSGGGSCECSDNGTKDGSRLKAQYLVGEDGSRVQLPAWFDAELGDTCQFQSFDNGEIRCVPSAPVLNSYVDPNCTIPVLVLKTACDVAPSQARVEWFEYGDVCTGPKMKGFSYVKFKTDNILNGVSTIYAINEDGQCQGTGAVPIGSGWRIYGTYPTQDSAQFVKASNVSSN